ncbi:MAG: hypothetical protein ACOX6Z_08020, partial [Dethiobacteria bacterium]
MPLFIYRPDLWLRGRLKILLRLCPENRDKPKNITKGTHPGGNDRRGKRRPAEIVLILAFILVFILLSGSGCWDKTEIEDLAILTAWGVDREENGDILASAVIVKPFAVAGQTGEGSAPPERPFWLASSSGRNMLEAMCNFATFSPRFIFCAHSRFVIFGEETARQGV